jgi:phytoene dehydrogenase-like protein
VLSFHPLFLGGNPFTTTSIYNLIPHLEHKWGVHFPMGGTGRLVKGLVDLVTGLGGSVRYGATSRRSWSRAGTSPACGCGRRADPRRHRGLERRLGLHLPAPAAGAPTATAGPTLA